ncbi:PAS domain-containing sensor histidine kinase [Caulobacter flavus]|uniref:histidine kinase n=1 Tax=Caulobacter flavus TaxID=1679497 RepID=A0A2N5CKF8_9CAUL|nr:ATP-binding protein [Caulobacter flavus]AYV47678.1 PAS domain-containing sensor histidine kinase [Caulobacter flavus]PLR05824.1 PAS domain-containing sensor histidine kinase [Caulobacter flavus]
MTALFRALEQDECGDLVDLAAEAVVVTDPAGVVRYWNPAAELLYGWPAMAMVGLKLCELAENRELHREEWALLVREGAWEGEVRRLGAGGTAVAADVRRTLRRHPNGTLRDVVEYGQAARSHPHWSALDARAELRRTTAACWELDTVATAASPGAEGRVLLDACRIIDVNARTVRVFGGSAEREQMIGRPLTDFWPAESRDDIAQLIADALKRPVGSPLVRTLGPYGLLAGAIATAWRSAEPGRSDALFLMVNGAASDDRTAWELRASEDRYRKLIHFTPTPLLYVDARRSGDELARLRAGGVTDIAGHLEDNAHLVELAKDIVLVTEVNEAAVRLFGARNAAELIQSVRYLFSATPKMANRVMKAHFEGRRNYVEQAKMHTFDGRVRDVVLSVTYPAPPEYLDTTFITIEDVTERLWTEAELRRLQANFAHAARLSTLGELAASVAHEVNQPLSAIMTNADTSLRWLNQEQPNLDKVRMLTERIAASAGRASQIIERIRGMAMKREPERTRLNLRATIEEAVLIARHEIEAKGIALTLALEDDLPVIHGDRIRLQQVVVNLLINSLQAIDHHGPKRREIRLAAAPTDSGVTIRIHDSGPGIAAEHLASVFDSFFTTKDGGIGIGLAICQSIITEHSGTISAGNHDAGGAIFTIFLPLDHPQA